MVGYPCGRHNAHFRSRSPLSSRETSWIPTKLLLSTLLSSESPWFVVKGENSPPVPLVAWAEVSHADSQ